MENSTRKVKTCRFWGGVILTILFSSVVFIISCSSTKQIINRTVFNAPFDMQKFSEQCFTAWWLYRYDMVAWWTSDSVMTENDSIKQQLSSVWFCFDDKAIFHAIYGHYDSLLNTYVIASHYQVDSAGKVVKGNRNIDSTIINPFARALITSGKASDPILGPILEKTGVRFNQYVKKAKDENIRVWFLPSMQEKAALYGIDLSYLLNANGDSLISSEVHNEGLKFFNISPKKEIMLSNESNEMPTIGNLFFAIQFRSHFKSIEIRNKASISEMMYSDKTKEYAWVHFLPR